MEIKTGEVIFVDTNILLIATDELREFHIIAKRLIGIANSLGFHLGFNGQIIREYLAVATRPPDANGLGMKVKAALGNIDAFRNSILFYEENKDVSKTLCSLVGNLHLKGKKIHDANIVATMFTHGILKLITENQDDFKDFSKIDTLTLDYFKSSQV